MGDNHQPLWRRSATHMLHAALNLKAELEERLQETVGINLADNEALLHLHHADGLKMSDIADRLVLSRGGVTKVVDRLEQDGLVERRPDAGDRRITMVHITGAGRAMVEKSRPVVDAALQELWASHLTDEEVEAVLAAIDKVMEANRHWF